MICSLYLIKKTDITEVVSDLNNVAGKVIFTYYKVIFLGLSPIERANWNSPYIENHHLLAAKYQPIPASQPTVNSSHRVPVKATY
jgi:hypothetical protein